jgi:predicted DNA-binding ribbon-helix-helix protein
MSSRSLETTASRGDLGANMARKTVASVGIQSPKPRIVQYKNRRYSIRLEPVFWQALESLAQRQSMRLGRYIAELAERYDGNNFASHLRVLSMVETERALARASLQPTHENILDVVLACASPGLVLSRFRTILAHNESFLDWLGSPDRSLAGVDLTSVIQVRTRRPLNDVWLDMVAGNLVSADANVLHVEPGRVIAAAAKLLALHPREGEDFYAVMWLSATRKPSSEPTRRRAPTGHGEAAA